ncbi:MAG: hypothetical protein ACKVT2_15510 [Saprospiraceae bacterium]
MKYSFCLTIFFLIKSQFGWAQPTEESLLYKINFEKHTIKGHPDIEFILSKDTTVRKKPLILFIQGSGSVPLVLYDSIGVTNGFPFKVDAFKNTCNFVVISKPGVPLTCPFELGYKGYKNPDGKFSDTFIQNDHLDYYVKSAESVLEYLQYKPFVHADSIFVIGHSQGYRVAAKLASTSLLVKKVVCMSANPMNRYCEYISERRFYANCGLKDHKIVQQSIDSITSEFVDLSKSKLLFDTITEVPPQFRNSISFNFDLPYTHLLTTNAPILIVYGTRDIGAQLNDLLPIIFSASGKSNILLKAFPDLDHNFFKNIYDTHGTIIKKEFYWDFVFNEVLMWLLNK